MNRLVSKFLLFTAFVFTSYVIFAQKLALSSYGSGLTMPIDIKHCGDDRLFVGERIGRIRVLNGAGTLLPTPMLDIQTKISSTASEEGFLGIAFSPTHKTDRKLYVNYTSRINGQLYSIIEEYKVSSTDSNVVDPASALEILRVLQPYSNHNGGNLMFGKDGFLYINFGDGGSGGDPHNNGQSLMTVLGKILRVDVRNSSNTQRYVVPTSNPFYNNNTIGIRKEIWAYGLRNPWRASVDRITGDIWIGDVGQGAREEIDFQPYSSPGGVNYGWRIMEGNLCYNPSSGCNMSGLQLPIYDYPRSQGFSVTGGYVHRSTQSKYLFGMYLFSDYGTKWIDGIRQTNGTFTGTPLRLLPGASAPGNPAGYGEDQYGDLYIAYLNSSSLYKITDTSHLRRPKAYILSANLTGNDYRLQALQGRNVTYQWLKNGTPVPGATSPDFTTTGNGTYQLVLTNEINAKDTSDLFSLSPLDVTLVDFRARRINQHDVELSWSTLSENNSSGFMLERRKMSERDFTNVHFMPTRAINGNSSTKLEYRFTDQQNLFKEKAFYRLKMIGRDNRFTYSNIAIVNAGYGKGVTIYPNPAKGSTTIDMSSFDLPVTMNIYDARGRRIFNQIISQPQYRLDVKKLKGIYLIELMNNSTRLASEKLFVE
jgi:hypothetical protein